MRTSALALLLLMAACGKGEQGANQAGGPTSERIGPQARAGMDGTVAIAATGPGGCSASWDGQPATTAQIADRSRAIVMHAIDAVGGVRNLTEGNMPIVYVDAPADLSFACADPILAAVQSSGVPGLMLRPTGRAALLVDFFLDTAAPPQPIPTVIGVGAGGQLTWNNDPVDATALGAELVRHGGGTAAPDSFEETAPPGGLELRVAREATVGQLYELLTLTHRYHVRPSLILPSMDGPPAPAVPPTGDVPPPVASGPASLDEPPPRPPGR